MVHGCAADAKLFASLAEMDAIYAEKVRAAGCADCGGPLDRADYERKPRGELGEAAEAYARRTSFCCRREGCRHRATPPSLRFLGRRVYVAVLVVVASVLGREAELVGRGAPRRIVGVPTRTVRRWLTWWSVTFVLTKFWAEAKGLFATPPDEGALPSSALDRLGGGNAPGISRLLRLIAPVTTTSVRAPIVMAM
jgi:hypothetical protein